jgi:hypothetical protein
MGRHPAKLWEPRMPPAGLGQSLQRVRGIHGAGMASPSSCSPLLACAPKSPYGQCMGPPSHPGHDLMRGEHLWFGARGHTAACCLNVIGNMTAGTKAPRAHGVVVSHPLRMRKALGSIPSVSISAVFCHDAQPPLCLAADMRILRMQDHLRVLAAVAFA